MTVLAFVRETNLLTDALVESYVKSQQLQLDWDFLPTWNLTAQCVFVSPGGVIPDGAWQVIFKDHSTEAGAIGFHDDAGNPTSYVFVADALADQVAWTVTASHEVLEMLADPFINAVADSGGYEMAREVCDAPEDDRYAYPVAGHHLSAFVLPSWFDPNGVAPFTFPVIPEITAPFMLAPGGYIGRRQLPDGQWEQQLGVGARSARQVKRPTSRTMRRFAA